MNKRKGIKSEIDKVSLSKCGGYTHKGKVWRAPDCLGEAFVGRSKDGMEMCNACHREFYRRKSGEIFRVLKERDADKPTELKHIIIVYKYISRYLIESFDEKNHDRKLAIASIHKDITADYVAAYKRYFKKKIEQSVIDNI